jgi:small-conductance mechanosensitive channel
MESHGLISTLGAVLDRTLFVIGGRPISPMTVVTVAAIMIVTVLLSRLTRRAIVRASQLRGIKDEGSVGIITYLVHVVFLVVGLGVALESIGIDLAALFTAGAAFAVAVGLAIQGVIQSFVAGVILLAERTIKPGDVLEIDKQLVKVREIGMRSTIVRTLDEEDLIVPNGTLVQATVKNYTFGDKLLRLRASVGVAYSSDLAVVDQALAEAAAALEWRVVDQPPVILLTGFGPSSVDFEVSVWVDDPWASRRRRSQLNHAVWTALKARDVVIAFPQVDVHFDRPVTEAIARLHEHSEAA